jgi:hypothetical protein
MKTAFFVLFLIFLIKSETGFSQSKLDTIITLQKKIPCVLTEIGPETIKYRFENEDVIQALYKNQVLKIVHKSGRIENFESLLSLQKIEKLSDYGKIQLTYVENDIIGLVNVASIYVKSNAVLAIQSSDFIRSKAFEKLKKTAALYRSELIFVADQNTQLNQLGGIYSFSKPTSTQILGLGFTRNFLNFDQFKKNISAKTTFNAFEEIHINNDFSFLKIKVDFEIHKLYEKDGVIFLEGMFMDDKKPVKGVVVAFDDKEFTFSTQINENHMSFRLNF